MKSTKITDISLDAGDRILLPQYNLDWTQGKVYGPDIDRTLVEKKFAAWDYVIANDVLNQKDGSGELTKLAKSAWLMLEDDTVFAYSFLKFNNKPVKLRYYQDVIINHKNRIIDVEAANQQGKTFTLCTKAACSFLRDHGKNHTIALVSRSQSQNGTNMRMIKQMLANSDLEWSAGANDSMSVTVRDSDGGYTNTLICAVAGGGALGLPVDLLLLDEFEFWVEDNNKNLEWYFDQIFYPRTFETRGQTIIYSNPNGKNFVSEDLQERKTTNGDYVCHTFNINFLDNPDNTREEWEERKSHIHPIIFASTMGAERTEGEGAALKGKDIDDMLNDTTLEEQGEHYGYDKECVFFLDLGFVHDQCALVGLAKEHDKELGKTVWREFYQKAYPINYPIEQVFGKQEGPEETVPQILRKYTYQGVQPVFGMDITGKEGNEVHARDVGLTVIPVKMSGVWKATWYGHWISVVKQRRFKAVNVDNYRDGRNKNFASQCRTLGISTKMPNGNTRPYPLYHHNTEKDLDDYVDATVGAFSLFDDEMGAQGGMTFLEHNSVKEYRSVESNTKVVDDVVYDVDTSDQQTYNSNQYQMF